jgi:hypothetical protein
MFSICHFDGFETQFHGGGIPTPDHALEYLALSPDLYDSSCINEQIKMQTRFNSLDRTALDVT